MKRIFIISGTGRTGGSFITRLFDSTSNTNALPNEFPYSYFNYSELEINIKEKKFAEFRKKNPFLNKNIKNLYNKDILSDEKIFEKIYSSFLSDKVENINTLLKKEIEEYNKLVLNNHKIRAFFFHSGVINREIIEKELDNFKGSWFVFSIRNPLEVYCSWKKRYGIDFNNQELLFPFINTYLNYISNIRYFISNYNDRTYVLFYESIFKYKNEELKKLCSFLDLEFNEKMSTPTLLGKLWYGNSMRGSFDKKLSNYNYEELLNNYEKENIDKYLSSIYNSIQHDKRTLIENKNSKNYLKLKVENFRSHLINENFKVARKKIIKDKNKSFFYNLFNKK